MAIAKKCDRCGKFYGYYITSDAGKYNALKRVNMNMTDTAALSCSPCIDLCKECMHDFDNFMSMKESDPTDRTIIFNNIKYKRVSKEDE